jgi:hypothetical protein
VIPGAGRLSDHERELVARVQPVVVVEPGTVMLNVLRPGSVERYLRREVSPGVWGQAPPFDYRLVGGTVVRQQDCSALRVPADFVRALRLDYPRGPFRVDQPVLHTMEFLAVDPAQFVTPFGAPSQPYPEQGFRRTTPTCGWSPPRWRRPPSEPASTRTPSAGRSGPGRTRAPA